MPPRLRCTVGNEGIRSREQINLPEDNEIISHLQLLDEERKQCRCAVVLMGVAACLHACMHIGVSIPDTNPCPWSYPYNQLCNLLGIFLFQTFFLISNPVSHATLYATGLLLVFHQCMTAFMIEFSVTVQFNIQYLG